MNIGKLTAIFGFDTSQAEAQVAKLKGSLASTAKAGVTNFFNLTKATENFTKGLQSGMRMSSEMTGLMIGMAFNPFTIIYSFSSKHLSTFQYQ